MERYDLKTYGRHLAKPKGYIARVGTDAFRHRFGGSSWTIHDPDQLGYGPTLLLTLDLRDPRLSAIGAEGIDELPLCAYLDCVTMGRQVYSIDPPGRKAILVERHLSGPPEFLRPEIQFPNPLPEKNLRLHDLKPENYPKNEKNYWACCDEFLGGDGVIRVLGPPIWLQWVEEETCRCGKPMAYVASIGYEVDNAHRQLLDAGPFFPGELATYFFFCKVCNEVVVIVQST